MSESLEHARAGFESGVCPTCGQQVKVVGDRQGHSPSGAAGGGASKEEKREVIEQPNALHYLAGAAIIGATLVFFFVSQGDVRAMKRWAILVMPFGLAATASLVMLLLRPQLGVRMIRWTVIAMVTAMVIALGLVLFVVWQMMLTPNIR